ncbi:MAG: hypothetical protein ACYC0O_08195 [Desulfurivibrionaceae bacterium]|jgi:uncharacterized membrane protein YkgB|nr:hypothetical protein [Pseudomonadota bacterium]MCG2822312.1 hypothetical protein [Desulfobulbaceae bacterium]MDP2002253.1 hypothetical protein [Desulfurivibrionaceae bacterium]PKN21457.1 MAG: hypothetical protein CVU68_07565 [Deltaproteobacteria bacterium HGW-Deltaproteobacteria-3]MBU4229272.1 hypothetical protein [Pseudomonadota bacterium]
MYAWLDRADIRISEGMDRYCQPLMRYSIALIFIWFGLLKPLGMSPEEELIKRTVYWVSPQVFLPVLGWWEVGVGLCLLYRPLIRIALLLLLLQLPGTMLPLILLPEICFTHPPFGLSLEGQYIVKNIFLVSAAFMIGGKVRAQ